MNYSELPRVKLIAFTRGSDDNDLGPEQLSAVGALGCFKVESSDKIWYNLKEKSKEKTEDTVKKVLKESAGRGHGSVADQNYFIFSIEGIPRLVTLFLCGPEYASHEQQSLRRATPDKGFYLPDYVLNSELSEKTVETLNNTFEFYTNAVQNGVPKEDARTLLPLYTRTNIQTGWNARELMHLRKMAQHLHIPSVIKTTVEEMMSQVIAIAPTLFEDTGHNYEILAWRPSSQLFAKENKTIQRIIEKNQTPQKPLLISYSGIVMKEDEIRNAVKNRNEAELANLKHIHFEFISPMSLSCFHQATRQRTWHQSVESIYKAIERAAVSVPPTIKKSQVRGDYEKQNNEMFDLFRELAKIIPKWEAVGVIPHSLEIYDLIHIDGWNAIHSIGKRTCNEAQWEIRKIARNIADLIKERNPAIGRYTEPQCITYEKCPERNPCGYFEAVKK